jgi:hypothetical protein
MLDVDWHAFEIAMAERAQRVGDACASATSVPWVSLDMGRRGHGAA